MTFVPCPCECCKRWKKEIAALRKEREQMRDPRYLYSVEDPCPRCSGLGRKSYGNTTGWRGTAGGSMMTTDVCDECWGTGEAHRKGADLRKLYGHLSGVEKRALDLLGMCGWAMAAMIPFDQAEREWKAGTEHDREIYREGWRKRLSQKEGK